MRPHLLVFILLLAGCVPAPQGEDAPPPPYPALSADRAQPLLALAEHVLGSHFVGDTAGMPSTCLVVRPTALTAQQEEDLVLRFTRLAPAQRCRADGAGHVDTITGQPAQVIQLYDFACTAATRCTGWAMLPGQPATRYTMDYRDGAWAFAGDRRLIAE
jgi:hypothetical protein